MMSSGREIIHGVQSIHRPLSLEWGAAQVALPGQEDTGDRYIVKPFRDGVLLAVMDGLGHGAEAAEASRKAASILETHPGESVISLVKRCHNELQGTRGVVMTIASIVSSDETMTWLTVGNVEAVLFRVDSRFVRQHEHIIMRGGVIGHNLPPLRASLIPLYRGDTIIFTTDGIKEGYIAEQIASNPASVGERLWSASRALSEQISAESPQTLAENICSRYVKGTDDALVLAVRYQGAAK